MEDLSEYLKLKIVKSDRYNLNASGQLSPHHPDLKGHFDNFPLLPAVSQLDIVQGLTERMLDQPIQIIECNRAKFAAMLQPDRCFEIAVTLKPGSSTGEWLIQDGNDIFSKGFFTYAVIPPPR